MKLNKKIRKCRNEIYKRMEFKEQMKKRGSFVNPIQDGHFWGCWGPPPFPKICHTYPTMMKLGTVIPYLKEIQKMYESYDTPLDLC